MPQDEHHTKEHGRGLGDLPNIIVGLQIHPVLSEISLMNCSRPANKGGKGTDTFIICLMRAAKGWVLRFKLMLGNARLSKVHGTALLRDIWAQPQGGKSHLVPPHASKSSHQPWKKTNPTQRGLSEKKAISWEQWWYWGRRRDKAPS
jgi:hypothetical protein